MDHEVFVVSNRKTCNFFKSENYKSNILISNPGKLVETFFFSRSMQNFFYFFEVFGVSLMHRWQYFTLFHYAECFGFFKTNQKFCVTSLCKSDSFGFTTSRVYFVNINYTIVWFYILDIIFFPIFCHAELFYILTNIFKIKVLWFRHQQHWSWISMCAVMQVRSKALKLWSTYYKLLCKGTAMYIGVGFLLTKQIPREQNVSAKFLWNFAPKFRWEPKKGLYRVLVLSQSGISDFLLPSGYYLPKNRGNQTYFAPFSVRSEKAPPPGLPKIDAYGYLSCSLLVIRRHFHTFKSKQQFFD